MEAKNSPIRFANVVAGGWLFVSAFAWAHAAAERANTWILGVLCVTFAISAAGSPRVRYLNALLSIWLFVSVWVLPHELVATVWNNVLWSAVVFVASLIPETVTITPSPRRRHA